MQPDDRTTLSESYADSELKRLQKREGFWSNLFEGMMTPVPIDASAFRMLAKVFINGLWAGGILFYLFRTWFPLIVFLSIVLTFQLVHGSFRSRRPCETAWKNCRRRSSVHSLQQ